MSKPLIPLNQPSLLFQLRVPKFDKYPIKKLQLWGQLVESVGFVNGIELFAVPVGLGIGFIFSKVWIYYILQRFGYIIFSRIEGSLLVSPA